MSDWNAGTPTGNGRGAFKQTLRGLTVRAIYKGNVRNAASAFAGKGAGAPFIKCRPF